MKLIDATTFAKPGPSSLDQVNAGRNAARILRQRVETNTQMEGDFERLMTKIEAGFAAALVISASAPPPERPFRVIDGGRQS